MYRMLYRIGGGTEIKGRHVSSASGYQIYERRIASLLWLGQGKRMRTLWKKIILRTFLYVVAGFIIWCWSLS